MKGSICARRQRHIRRYRDVTRRRTITSLHWILKRVLILWTGLTRLRRGDTQPDCGLEVDITFALVGLVTVPVWTPTVLTYKSRCVFDVFMLETGRRPSVLSGFLDLIFPVRLFRSEPRVLGWQAEHGGSVRVRVAFEILERRVQGRMVVEDVV